MQVLYPRAYVYHRSGHELRRSTTISEGSDCLRKKICGGDVLLENKSDIPSNITADDLKKILNKVEKIEQKLECKIDDISLEVCKLKEADSQRQTLSREHIRSIKEENVHLKR